jgi:hypothetical protein
VNGVSQAVQGESEEVLDGLMGRVCNGRSEGAVRRGGRRR